MASQVWPIPPDSPLMGRAVDLYDSVRTGACQDEFTEESLLFAFMLEYERFGHSLLHPAEARERLLKELRIEVLNGMRNGVFHQVFHQMGLDLGYDSRQA